MPRSPLKNYKKLMDKSFISVLGKMCHSKCISWIHSVIYHLTRSSMIAQKPSHGREKACDLFWWMKSKEVKLNNLGTSCSLKFIVQTISLTIIGIIEEIQSAENLPHSKHKLNWSRLAFLHHQQGKSIPFIQSNWDVTFALEFTQW